MQSLEWEDCKERLEGRSPKRVTQLASEGSTDWSECLVIVQILKELVNTARHLISMRWEIIAYTFHFNSGSKMFNVFFLQGNHPEVGAHEKFTNYKFDVKEFLHLMQKAVAHVKNHRGWQNLQDELKAAQKHEEL